VSFLLVLIRKAKWYRTEATAFLAAGDISADCLSDLRTTGNELSAWYVEDNKSNLTRILTALGAGRDDLVHVDYLIFDHSVPTTLGIKLRKTGGLTPDKGANAAWHYDLIELSARKLVELAVAIFEGATKERIPVKTVAEWIKGGVARNEIDGSKLKPNLAGRLFPSGKKRSGVLGRIGTYLWSQFRKGFRSR